MSSVPLDAAQMRICADDIRHVSPAATLPEDWFLHRRVTRARERTPKTVSLAVPTGYALARNVPGWVKHVTSHPRFQKCHANKRVKLTLLLDVLKRSVDGASKTFMPTWGHAAEALGVSVRTIARYLRDLRSWGVLTVVATGRSAEFAGKATGEYVNEAAIYAPIEALGTPGKSVTPRGAGLREEVKPMRAHTYADTTPQADRATPELTFMDRAAARHGVRPLLASRTEPFFPHSETTTGLDKPARAVAYVKCAAELQWLVTPLQHETTKWVAHQLKPYLDAGWTIRDVKHALDWKADGAMWPHAGADGMRSMRAFLAVRLDGGWRDDQGRILPSLTQQEVRRRPAPTPPPAPVQRTTPPAGGWRALVEKLTGKAWQ